MIGRFPPLRPCPGPAGEGCHYGDGTLTEPGRPCRDCRAKARKGKDPIHKSRKAGEK